MHGGGFDSRGSGGLAADVGTLFSLSSFVVQAIWACASPLCGRPLRDAGQHAGTHGDSMASLRDL
eukprot:7326547-Pyramimonas_sp.AAC.1